MVFNPLSRPSSLKSLNTGPIYPALSCLALSRRSLGTRCVFPDKLLDSDRLVAFVSLTSWNLLISCLVLWLFFSSERRFRLNCGFEITSPGNRMVELLSRWVWMQLELAVRPKTCFPERWISGLKSSRYKILTWLQSQLRYKIPNLLKQNCYL